jgi:D-inositol-3-phosphate glycosyltransferase
LVVAESSQSSPSLARVSRIQRVAMISVHTSPLAILGGKDAGGLNVYVRELARQLDASHVMVDIFTRRYDETTPEIVELSERVRVISIEAGPQETVPKDDLFCLLPEFASEMALFSLREGLRYDIVHSHYWLSGWVANLLKRYWNAPTVHVFHTLAHLKNRVSNDTDHESTLRVQVERRLLEVLDNIVAPNPDERAELIWTLGADNARICTIPPGIDLSRFHPRDVNEARKQLDLPDNPIVLFIGRVDPIKGIDTLIDAFAALRNRNWGSRPPKLVFIGGTVHKLSNGDEVPGEDLAPVLERARQHGVEADVIFRGAQPQDLLPLYYSAATVCVVTSLYESFGLVAVEAMACGIPVVATRVGGMKFTVEEDVSGLLVPSGDATAIADALATVIQDRQLRSTLQVGARQAAIRFSWHTVGSAVLNLYERLADGERENLCCYGEIYAS